ncbi:BRO-N domain-containing protein [Pannonibacter phragmitetus]|uniref:BRO-N domain-containing protein n=1 Tax=Pannonibacter phragmitetus TaxID=121719 RepID=UPI000F038A00|nr:Bro-N domain-containing protein [Pannonibacter phragmitetus]
MTNLTTFNYLSNTVRVVEIDGQPWFVAADVCVALDAYVGPRSGKPNVTMAIQKLDADECRFNRIEFTDRLGRNHASKVMLISESGLYKLIMRSDKPEARKFQDWVTREVLPAIRKDGMYVAGEEKLKTGRPVAERQRLVSWR